MKRLIVCTDGTWNSSENASADGSGKTNVQKVCEVIVDQDAAGVPQLCKYHIGVGAQGSWWEKMGGGAFGVGLSNNVKHCYEWLVNNYDPGDELFFFGFSRGAFTARSIVGLVRNAGILRREHVSRVDEAYVLYRARAESKHPNGEDSLAFRAKYSYPGEVPIKCIGLWDTVGALGVPTRGLVGWWTRRKYGFHDVGLSSTVENAFHALAIDELRKPFAPTLWEVSDKDVRNPARKQRVEQVWFPGVHSNVGGGYPDARLSDLALKWMLIRAVECGLAIKADTVEALAEDHTGTLYNSMTTGFRVMGVNQRAIRASRVDDETKEPIHTFEEVSSHAFRRRSEMRPPAVDAAYDPPNLRAFEAPA